jgi:hypothetical protein
LLGGDAIDLRGDIGPCRLLAARGPEQ